MKFSYNWLQTYFAEPLPSPKDLAEKITFHSSEVEEVLSLEGDTVLDIKVLPDKSPWLMSHRGLAREVSVILNRPLVEDLFKNEVKSENSTKISICRTTSECDFYAAALVEGVKVGPSPKWLVESLAAVGQRSINNIVDATNFVMFELGQPLHAFDAEKINTDDDNYLIEIRKAESGEEITTLANEKIVLSASDVLITDGVTRQPIGIAGVKGGNFAAVSEGTKKIIIESAHFNRVSIRNTAKRLNLPTDAAKRFENGINVAVAPIAFKRVIKLILEIGGGVCVAETFSGDYSTPSVSVSCSLTKINSVLGLNLSEIEVGDILTRFDYKHEWGGGVVTVLPPFERDDIIIAEDLIEEIGRIYGLNKVKAIVPTLVKLKEFNARFYYAEKIRNVLLELGFSEVYTSSFRDRDIVKLENALASDKGYLRSTLAANLQEARERNIPHRDLLGLSAIKLFEIGSVFEIEKEEFHVALAIQTGTAYKAKVDDSLLEEALIAISEKLGVSLTLLSSANGVAEFSLDNLLSQLPPPTNYEKATAVSEKQYQAFSLYPAIVRDVAMWLPEKLDPSLIIKEIRIVAGQFCVRITHLDTFEKDGRISYAFRLVFQSKNKTLTDGEVQVFMDSVYKSIANKGWEVR